MKNFFAILLILCSYAGFSQSTPPVNRSSSTITAVDQRVWNRLNFKIPVFLDTIVALAGGIDSIGLMIWEKPTSTLWLRDTVVGGGHKWTAITGGSGPSIPYVDTLYFRSGDVTDSLFYQKDGVEYLHYVVDIVQYGVLSGGNIIETMNSYCRNVLTANFRIGRTRYTAAGVDSICMAPCDSLPRIDVFYADTLGNIGILTGVPDTFPVKPQVDQTWQVELSFVQVQCDTSGPVFRFPNFIYWGIGNIPYGHNRFIYDSVNSRVEINANAYAGVPITTKLSIRGDAIIDGDWYFRASNANNRQIRFGTQFLNNQNTQSSIVYDANARRFTFGGTVSGVNHNTNNGINTVAIMDSMQSHPSFFGTQSAYVFGVFSSRKGILFPRVNSIQMENSTWRFADAYPGIVLYNTDSAALCFWNGSVWRKVDQGGGSGSSGIDTLTYRSGINTDTLVSWKDGVATDWYVVVVQNGLISPGTVTWTGTGFDYYVTSAVYRKNGVLYTSPDAVVTLPPLTDIDSARTDVFIVNTSSVATSITGVESANPITPQIDPETDVFLTQITINPGQTSGLTDTAIIYDENDVSEWTGGASGVTVDFNGATNVYRGVKTTDIGAINNGDVIGYGYGSLVNRLDYAGISQFIRLKAVMPGSNNLTITFFNGVTQVTNELTISLNKSNITTYQGVSIAMAGLTWSNNFFDSVRYRYSGGGAGISGLYLDFVYLQNGIAPVAPPVSSTITATNNWGQTWTITSPSVNPNLSLVLDTTVTGFATRAKVQDLIDSLAATIGPGGTTTASNLPGSGIGVWKDKVVDDLRFKRLVGGTRMNITDMTDSVMFSPVDSFYYDLVQINDTTYLNKRIDGIDDTVRLSNAAAVGTVVSSVALAMPSGFTVSGSPITGSGTFTVAGAGTALQYFNGLGQLATFSDTLVWKRYGTTNPNNIRSWNAGGRLAAAQLVASSGSTITALDSANFLGGFEAGLDMTSAYKNLFLGTYSGRKSTTSFGNIGIGNRSMGAMSAAPFTGSGNVAIGMHQSNSAGPLAVCTSCQFNVAIGGNSSSAFGPSAGAAITTALRSTLAGAGAGAAISTQNDNTGIGNASLITTASAQNTAVGSLSGTNNSSGSVSSLGFASAGSITTGGGTALGIAALSTSGSGGTQGITGIGNIGIGASAYRFTNAFNANTSVAHARNIAIGDWSMPIGYTTLITDNIFIGNSAGNSVPGSGTGTPITGLRNIAFGSAVRLLSESGSDQFVLGSGANINNRWFISDLNGTVRQWRLGGNTTDLSATVPGLILDITGTGGGVRMPQLTSTEMGALGASPTGTEIYNTTDNAKMVFDGTNWTGFRYNAGTSKYQGGIAAATITTIVWTDLN